jgi:hypothetical protein
MRQPKIYISLPSKGRWWKEGSLQISENSEYPVYSMTAKDELMFKTPDALMNGQSIVEVIQSCMPNIKNAWDIPTMDFDLILIAIRLATYGDKMPIKHKIPVINEEVEHELDLRVLIDKQQSNTWIDQIVIDPDFIVYVNPLTYKHLTKTSIQAFETTRILNLVNDNNLTEEQKLAVFNESFTKLTSVTIDLVGETIYKILSPTGEVTDTDHIRDFVNNIDKELFQKIQKHLQDLKKQNDLLPLEFTTTEEQQSQGAPATYSVPINFNESDFFGQGF